MKKLIYGLVSLITIASMANADENIIGGTLGYGTQEFNFKKHTANDGDSFTFDLYYRRMATKNIGVDAGYIGSTGGIVSAFVGELSEIKDASFSGPRLSLYGQYPLNSSNVIYTKLGASFYQVDYTLNKVDQSDHEIGADLQLGWEMLLNSGIGVNLGYQYGKSSTVKMNNFYIGTSYHF
ncbi:OmpA-like transmembrane domain protein [Moritella viscosa]|uniref:OmpA-like transmembrane domain protein n=1 Tax=Moritella viscosa TaxID=80854 RepID=A0A1L0BQE5_9GAMM|nr:porin family protein [Moritella viscosa]SGZ00304.1 OmpA-like transmembrane domain protein [Moritella viscosa]SGZ00723.1 OmpA-like transmembrane domain protein [Moritella viscosa]SGZ06753.1 OmpA-like transmembrane domain protein [Moritella viscosa]SHO10540.1 OmpA-like transmembrane domain protein [Moritella viscosa]SHO14437.1 OmpA-like transmembrane domain protein [Moritella viscosa]